ncbi:MAG: hypothetical protein J6S82_05595, partial [Bacteroidales bacterium]|nr:hypothetical protein [Bacteroidales bacterium]
GQRGNLVRTQSFAEDLPDGKWVEYDNHGEKLAEGSYKKAAKNGTWSYYDKGQVIQQVVYKNGMKSSESKKGSK